MFVTSSVSLTDVSNRNKGVKMPLSSWFPSIRVCQVKEGSLENVAVCVCAVGCSHHSGSGTREGGRKPCYTKDTLNGLHKPWP